MIHSAIFTMLTMCFTRNNTIIMNIQEHGIPGRAPHENFVFHKITAILQQEKI